MVGVPLGLVKNLSFSVANVKANPTRSVRKARCDALESLLCVDDNGDVVHKEKVSDLPLLYLGVGL